MLSILLPSLHIRSIQGFYPVRLLLVLCLVRGLHGRAASKQRLAEGVCIVLYEELPPCSLQHAAAVYETTVQQPLPSQVHLSRLPVNTPISLEQ